MSGSQREQGQCSDTGRQKQCVCAAVASLDIRMGFNFYMLQSGVYVQVNQSEEISDFRVI